MCPQVLIGPFVRFLVTVPIIIICNVFQLSVTFFWLSCWWCSCWSYPFKFYVMCFSAKRDLIHYMWCVFSRVWPDPLRCDVFFSQVRPSDPLYVICFQPSVTSWSGCWCCSWWSCPWWPWPFWPTSTAGASCRGGSWDLASSLGKQPGSVLGWTVSGVTQHALHCQSICEVFCSTAWEVFYSTTWEGIVWAETSSIILSVKSSIYCLESLLLILCVKSSIVGACEVFSDAVCEVFYNTVCEVLYDTIWKVFN